MLKKLSVLTMLMTLSYSFLSAQEKPSFIALKGGISFPVGIIQSQVLPDGGFAQTGGNISLEGAWFFKSFLGIGASANANLLPVNVRSLGYEMVKRDAFLEDMYIRSEAYRFFSFSAGPYFSLPIINKLSFTAKILGGIAYASTPYQLFKPKYYLVDVNWYEITPAHNWNWTISCGAGLKYELNKCMGITLDPEFTYSPTQFSFTKTDGSVITQNKTMSFFNLLAGIYFIL